MLGRINRLGGPDTLYIPIDLLGLDRDALQALVSRLLFCAGGLGDVAPGDASHPAAGLSQLGSAPVSDASTCFDPDVIVARYMAERDQLKSQQMPHLSAPRRATFGRRVV